MRDKLLAIQRREALRDREMAARLEIARSTWTEIKNGRLALSDTIMLRAVRIWPELLPLLVMSVSTSADAGAVA